jgi:hypothetical protein
VSKKPWTAERRWQSLVKKGVLAPDASPHDLEALTMTVSSALSPTIYSDGVRSADLRLLFEVFVDALAIYLARGPEEVRADRAPAVWHLESIARAAGDTLDADHRLRFLEAAVRASPRSVVLRVRLADHLLRERRHSDAEEVLRGALELCPSDEDAARLLRVCEGDPERRRR